MTTLTQHMTDIDAHSRTAAPGYWIITGLRRWARILLDHMSEGAYRMNSEHVSCFIADEWIYRGRL